MTSRQACNTRLERSNRMLEALEPTKDPAWTISHEGYNVLTESAVESRLAFGNGRYGDDLPEVAGWSWGREALSAGVRSTEADNV